MGILSELFGSPVDRKLKRLHRESKEHAEEFTKPLGARLGLHHGIANYFPESLLSRIRKLRSSWYNRKYQSMTDSS
jgi:hypothetical protein